MESHPITHTIDAGMIAIAAASLLGWLPVVASVLSIVWMALRIYETRTVQQWLGKHREVDKE